jgi:hypothetical protein
MADLFSNNTSNDFINPELAPCSGASDSAIFSFLPGQQVGIISGSDILAAMGLSDISQIVQGWTQQTAILQPGEVIFIQGLTKGITNRFQKFLLDDSSITHTNQYMSVDLSINYYRNFKFYQDSIVATSDYSNGIYLETALNMAFDAKGIKAEATYIDASSLNITGTQAGYYFNITNINASTFVPDTSMYEETLIEDTSSGIQSTVYPNSAMLGYALKVTYPDSTSTVPLSESELWINLNHVPNSLTYYEPIDSSTYAKYTKTVDVGLNGSSTSDTMSAGDYLYYVDSNSKWEKVGVLKIWLSAPDADATSNNLIPGFYLYNPHTFNVKIDYLIIL